MDEIDQRIIIIINILITYKKVKNVKDFSEKIGMLRSTISRIKKGINHFTVIQIDTMCKMFDINPSCIFGYEDNVFREDESIKINNI